jgi:glycosyltransferase involved in cell wall biosynthesis
MMVHDSLISVLIPVFNGADYLGEAVKSALGQTLAPHEVIVVDDGSTDDTASVAASFGSAIRYDRQPHTGVSAALNRAIRLAEGGIFAFLDADDVWMPDKLQKQAAVLHSQPEIDMVFGHSRHFLSPDVDADAARRLHVPDTPQPAFIKSAFLVRRSSFLKVGFFDTDVQLGDFIDWFARAAELGLRAHMLPDVVFRRRVHGRNMTILEHSSQGDFVRVLKAALDRRRSAKLTRANPGSNA